MSKQGIEFLHNWIQHLLTETDRGRDRTRAMVLADKFRDAAATQGYRYMMSLSGDFSKVLFTPRFIPPHRRSEVKEGLARHEKLNNGAF